MSGFQIPGLGQAKPNETLPPLPSDLIAAAASAAGHEDIPHAPAQQTTENIAMSTTTAAPVETQVLPDADAMVLDEQPPASPPSLTSALEAAIGGLASEPVQHPPAQEQPQEQTESVPLQNDTGDNPEWEIDSSPYESSSESSSDSSSDDESDDNEGYQLLGVEETARMLMEAEAGSDDEAGGGPSGGKSGNTAHLRTKNELAEEEAITLPDVTITEDMPLEELGSIEHTVDATALILGAMPGEYQVLDTGSVLCTASRLVVGTVSETIGKVTRPMYTVRFNNADEMATLGVAVGTKLFYTPAHATFVFTAPLRAVKGSDASNLYDEEAADDEVEFSDDEKEAEHKRALKQKKKDKWKANNPEKAAAAAAATAARARDHPLRQQHNVDAGLNYDDGDEDGPYKPLARPSSLASGPGASQYDQPSSSRHGGGPGGRRGGDFRGRGRSGGRGGRGGYARGGGNSREGYSLPPQGNQYQNQYAQPPPPAPQSSSMPQVPFGMQFPGWPPAPAPGAVPPPPPGWPGSAAAAVPPTPTPPPPPQFTGQSGAAGGLNLDPAMIAAIMGQIQAQAANNAGGAWGGQQQQQPPPPGR
ncbi:H/ACA ribonucleoprotein complex, subunit Gar1/Naf1 [Cordyceps fumosorosea ARSEF 2679]|uniref:H/ACA ribonucleoprotein complex non-core subunit NAF1 n=1 Tax=Cordyceps fumosorosea (strain ARSEF 2679) TaxID=1081104 RepID=A0A167TPR3_CORFA|nr:H/ACA ribonucleoprotein complex, subunit Gar1/Naf1 [Cordyceps fumosorosea ARSEF 2679]OAA60819.1 H/ACA ribonucleoprotein complex, subunit Gar1/Naf1 [Cordyceps fumosorosea ARSEF 2679]